MELRFGIDIEDMMAFQNHFYETNGHTQALVRKARLLSSSVMLLAGVGCYFFLSDGADITLAIYFLLAAIFFYFFIPKRSRSRSMKTTRKRLSKPENSIWLGERTLSFSREGIDAVTPQTKEFINWSAVREYHITDRYLFLYLSEISALVIPRFKIGEDKSASLMEILSEREVPSKNYENKKQK